MATINGTTGDDLLLNNVAEDDTIDGGAGTDTVSYANAGGVLVDLSSGFAFDPVNGDFDTLISMENVTGSAFDDLLTGDAGANVLDGGAGSDYMGGGAGNDTLIGGLGADVFKFSFESTPGGGGGETFSFTQFFAANGGSVINGEVADGTKQGQFSSLYTQWLESLGLNVLDLGQNNSGVGGTPVVEGPIGTFGERESFTWTSGSAKKPVTHDRWYSDTWTPGGQDTVTSGDGFDTILDFTWGVDKLEFNGLGDLTEGQFTSLFDVTQADVNGDSVTDTTLALAGGSWQVTLVGISGHTDADLFGASIFS